MEAGRWPKEALRFSFEGSRGVGRPKVGTDWCGNVKSITEQIQHTWILPRWLHRQGSQCCRVAPRRSPTSLDAVRSQPEVDTRMMTMTSRRWRVGQCEAVLTNLWLTALNQLQPTSGVQASRAAGSQTACLIKAGTLLNIWLYFIRTHAWLRVLEWKLCVLDLRLDQKIDGASGCALMHALRRGSGWYHGSLRAPHAVLLGCTI
jgi:hypothetical protein